MSPAKVFVAKTFRLRFVNAKAARPYSACTPELICRRSAGAIELEGAASGAIA
jgi:hypothetical protein